MKGKFKNSFWFHFAIVALLCSILYGSFFATLNWITKHGEEVKIPDVRGANMDSAVAVLKAMQFEVLIDSTYETDVRPLSVLKQVPDTGSLVKQGRTVFLTVNMMTPPKIPMPNLVNLSFRSAEMLLRNNKLILGDTSYRPDIALGAILEQQYKGTPIKAGELIAQGSKINLIIGDGLGNTQFTVPDVTGQTIDLALTILAQYSLQPIIVVNDQMSEISDTMSATVVDQEPRATNDAGTANQIKAGDIMTLKIIQNPSAQEIHKK